MREGGKGQVTGEGGREVKPQSTCNTSTSWNEL